METQGKTGVRTLEQIMSVSDLYLKGQHSTDDFIKAVATEVNTTYAGIGQYILTLSPCLTADYMVDRRGDLGSTHLEFSLSDDCQLTRQALDAVWGASKAGPPQTLKATWVLHYPDQRKPGFKYRGGRIKADMTAAFDSPETRIRSITVSREKP